MDVRKPIIDNFSSIGKFFDSVNSSRNQSNLRQINVLQDISKQSQTKSKYQKLLENLKSKPIYEILDQNKSTDQELTKEVHNYYAELHKVFPRAINKRRISSYDRNVLSRSIEGYDNLTDQQMNLQRNSPQQSGNMHQSILGNSRNINNQNPVKQSKVHQLSVKTPKKDIQIDLLASKIKTNNEIQQDQNNQLNLKNGSKKKKRNLKKSVFHILSDSDDQSSVCSERGNFVSEEYDASNQVFSVQQNNNENVQHLNDKSSYSETNSFNIDLNSSNNKLNIQKLKTPTKFNLRQSNLRSIQSETKQKVQTEPDNSPISFSAYNNVSSLYDISEKNDCLNFQKKINSKFKPINASLSEIEPAFNKSGLYSKENLASINIPILQPLNIQGKQNRSFSSKIDDSSIYQTLSGSKTTKVNRDLNSRNSSSFSIHYENKESSLEKKSKFATLQTIQQQNSTEFYYGSLTPINHKDQHKNNVNPSLRRYKNHSNESRLYHFDFIKEDLSPKMQSEKRSLRMIQKLFEQSKQIQILYKNTEEKINKMQNSIYDSLQKSIEVMEEDPPKQEAEESTDEYQQLLIHTGLTTNQENINQFKIELRKKSNEIQGEASTRNIQKLKKGISGIHQQKKMKQEFPLQKMPQAINESGKFQAIMQANNFNVE